MNESQPSVCGFHHAAIRASDFDASIAFYAGVLGLTAKLTWGEPGNRAIMLDAGQGDYLEIFERPDAPTTPRDPEPPLLHIAFRTSTLAATLEAVRSAGMEVTMEQRDIEIPNTDPAAGQPGALPRVVPVRIAFFRGPDGELVELFENALT
ncbi:MAG: VOC family protein [Planctomycetota bacterium]